MELIRPERNEEAAAVWRVHETAFPTAAEAELVECRAWGAGFIVVIGDPPHYGRFGFEPAEKHGLRSEYDA